VTGAASEVTTLRRDTDVNIIFIIIIRVKKGNYAGFPKHKLGGKWSGCIYVNCALQGICSKYIQIAFTHVLLFRYIVVGSSVIIVVVFSSSCSNRFVLYNSY